MDSLSWQRARRLFEQALELPPAARDALLNACDDAQVRAEALALLEADACSPTGATNLAYRVPDLLDALASDDADALAAVHVGRRFGPWRLQRVLGQGGMGAVYLAERVEGGFAQRAALKLVRPGFDTEDLLTRLRYERQILAGLEHPSIARLLDGGAGPGGEPFLALEYVEGRDLRAHCDAQRLDLQARLQLFLTVCEAVAHAHARLVVHRDLKPSNILVTDEGTVKLLDFGIAKLIDTEQPSEATAARVRRFTPEYAAPEQIRGETSTTAVDVYALGVLLYELLTGSRPYRTETRAPAGIEYAVLHQDVGRPSAAVTKRVNDDTEPAPATRAQLRRTTPARLRALLRGDLDAIVLKALRKSPAERYASVRLMADDVRACLEQRPVAARRGSRRYRMLRFAQRHALAMALAGIALASLVAGLGAAVFQAREASRQRDAAQAEASKARAALQFMQGLFALADPGQTQGERVTARELLARGSQRIRGELASQPQVRAELLRAMGEAHLGLGLYGDALPLLQEAAHDAPANLESHLAQARALHELGRFQEVIDLLLPFRASASVADELLASRVELRIAMAQQALNRLVEAEAAYRMARATQIARLGEQHRETQETTLRYAALLVLADRAEEARPLTAAVVDALRRREPRDEVFLASALGAHAMVVSNTGPRDEAESLRREELALNERIYGSEHPTTISSLNNLATVLFDQRRVAEADAMFERVLAARRAQYGADHPAVATAANNHANALLALGRLDEAEPVAREALRIRLASYGENHHTTAASLRSVGGIALERGDAPAALPWLERALAAFEVSIGPQNSILLGTLNDLTRARLALGDDDNDCATARRALALSDAASKPDEPGSHYQFALLGACRAANGDAGGLSPLRAALPAMTATFGADDRRTRVVAALVERMAGGSR